MANRLNIVGVSGNIGHPSRTLALTEKIIGEIADKFTVSSHIIDLSRIAVEVGTALSRAELPADVERELARIESADLLVVAVPVYKGGYPGHFKHLFDLVDQFSLIDKPVVLAATGGSERHTLVIEYQLRPLFSFFQSLTLPLSVYATSADFTGYQVTAAALQQRIADTVNQLPVLFGGSRERQSRAATA
jgi:FMN reductase